MSARDGTTPLLDAARLRAEPLRAEARAHEVARRVREYFVRDYWPVPSDQELAYFMGWPASWFDPALERAVELGLVELVVGPDGRISVIPGAAFGVATP